MNEHESLMVLHAELMPPEQLHPSVPPTSQIPVLGQKLVVESLEYSCLGRALELIAKTRTIEHLYGKPPRDLRVRVALGDYASVQYWLDGRVRHQIVLAPNFIPNPGFCLADPDVPDCGECRVLANRYLDDKLWLRAYDPKDLCRTCMRSPVEYWLGHLPDHQVWFERSVRIANKTRTGVLNGA